MIEYFNCFNSEEEKKAFVIECEKDFEARLSEVTKKIAGEQNISYITLSGPTCSGKTTTAEKMISDFSALNRKVHVVSLDNFYRPRNELKHIVGSDGKKHLDYETVNAIDLSALGHTVNEIFKNTEVKIPCYNFEKGDISSCTMLKMEAGDLVVFEGIQAVYPEVVALFSEHKYKSIYINVTGDVKIGGHIFSGRDVRFWRRIVRDYNFRGAEPEFTYYLWDGVCKNEDENMTPYEKQSDIMINSLMPYEPGIIKSELIDILNRVNKGSKYYTGAQEIIAALGEVQKISHEYLPDSSVYHEFLG